MKIILIGGHLSPALSVFQELPKDTRTLFVGRKYGFEGDSALSLEYKTIVDLKIPFAELNTGRLQRKLTEYTFSSLFKLPFGILQSFLILIKFKPDVVVGFGGYVSLPVMLCAYFLRIPIVIHEQTLEAGFANKLLSRFATKICISWSTSRKYFSKNKIVFTGNPIRKFKTLDLQFLVKKENKKLPLLFVTGGSSGSHFINSLIEKCLKSLLEKFNVIHQTGDAQEFHDFERLEELKSSLPQQLEERYILKKFIEPSEVGSVLNKADLVISRSGMNTVTELLYFQKPSLLIPLPFSQNNEQAKNAKFLEKTGLGKILNQKDIDSTKLLEEVSKMLDNINNIKIKKGEEKNLNSENAAKNIVEVIDYVYRSKKKKIF